MRKHFIAVWLLCGVTLIAAGCTTYYKVSDPSSGRAYYTTKVKEGVGGSVKFKDEKSGNNVTLQSSEVREISADEFKAAVAGPEPSPQK